MKSPKSIRALLLVFFAALLLNGCGGGDSYETFSLAMDTVAGEGKWSDQGHSTSTFGGELTVEGLTVNNAETGESLEITTLVLKKPLAKEELQAIIDAKDWKDRQETAIAGGLVLKGVKRTMKTGDDGTFTTTLDELNLENVSLTAADSNAMGGLAGFLKAARIGRAAYSNLKGVSAGGNMDMETSLAQMNAEGLAFDAEPMTALEALDPSGMAAALSSFSAKSLSFKDMAMTGSKKGEEAGKISMNLASLDQKDLKGFRAASSWALSGLKFAFEDDENNVSFGLESLALNEVDMNDYINKFMPLIIASATGEEDVENLINSMQTFADFFVSPVSMKDAAIKGLDLQINKMFGLKMAEAAITGPLTAGAIAPKQSSTVTGFEFILPESAEGLDPQLMDLYQFGQDFGVTRFVLDMAADSSYDAATGRLTSNVSKFTIKDLIDIKMVMNFGGFTDERLTALKGVTLDNAFMALMMNPEGVFGDMSIEDMDLTFSNMGLLERIYAYVGQAKMDGATADQVRDMASGAAGMALAAQGGEYLQNPEKLGSSLSAFLKEPKTLRITAKAEPPLSVISARAYEGDSNKLLNSLKLTVIANGESGVQPLVFNLPQAPRMNYEEPEEEMLEEGAEE